MATSGNDVVITQPQSHSAVASLKFTSSPIRNQISDTNGETILFEGKCLTEALMRYVMQFYFQGCYICCRSIIGIPCALFCLPVGACCGVVARNIWSLYLTNTSICFREFSPTLACCYSCTSNKIIALSDINDIRTVSLPPVTVMKKSCCCPQYAGTVISPPTSIQIELKEGVSSTLCCGKPPKVIQIDFCENATEFVEKVKQQMNVLSVVQ